MEPFEQPYRRPVRLKALLLFFLRPRAFIEMAVEHDIAWLVTDEKDIRASYLRGEYKPNVSEHRSNAETRSKGLRRTLLRAGLVVFIAAGLGLLGGYFLLSQFGRMSQLTSNLLQALAVGVILWATLWQLTKDLQSFGGKSLPERVHGWIFNSLYTLGTFVLFVVYGWQI